MAHSNDAVSRIALLAAQAANIHDEFEKALQPVMRAELPVPPVPRNDIEDDPQPKQAPLPTLFADLHDQMDILERQLNHIATLMSRVEL